MAMDVDPSTPPRGAGRQARVHDLHDKYCPSQAELELELLRATKDTALLALTHTLRSFFVGTQSAAPGVDHFPQYRFKRCRRRTKCSGWWVYSSDGICSKCRTGTDNGGWPCIRDPDHDSIEHQILYEMVAREDLGLGERVTSGEGADEEGAEAMLEMDLEEMMDDGDGADGTLDEVRTLRDCRAEDAEMRMYLPGGHDVWVEDDEGGREGMEVLLAWEDEARDDNSLADPELYESESERSA